MTSLHFFCLNAQPQGCYHCSKEHKFPTNGFKSQMSRPTGRNDQKPLARADFLRQIPLLCPALPPCDLTLIGALLIRGIRRSSDNAATRPKLPITPTVLNEIRKLSQLTLTDSFDATNSGRLAWLPFIAFLGKPISSCFHEINSMNVNISVEVTYTSLAGVWLWLSDGTKLFNLSSEHC